MHWSSKVVTAGAFALSLLGCSEQLASPSAGDAKRAVLRQRVRALKVNITQTGRMTVEQLRELEEIRQGITDWQALAGRTDLSMSRSRSPLDAGTAALISRGRQRAQPAFPARQRR